MSGLNDPKLQAFRAEVRAFCLETLPLELRQRVFAGGFLEREDYVGWQKKLAARGWLAGSWPKEYGGCGWSPQQSYIFQEESATAGAPWFLPFGVDFVGPVIFTFGNDEQKKRYLPGILSVDTFWCQGYSEPNAGSDLAGLRTRAVREGDHYIVNGSKIWTTMAQWADMMFALVRTDPDARPQAGISFLLIDLRSPGINIRPIETIDGAHHLNQVFFDDVKVPVANRVGEENKGWHYAKFLLGNERLLAAEVGRSKRVLGQVKKALAQSGGADLQRRSAQLELDLLALEWTTLRLLSEGKVTTDVSALKLRGGIVLQQLGELLVDVLGQDGLAFEPQKFSKGSKENPLPYNMRAVSEFLYLRATTIYGGSNEVQRGIIVKQVLGL